MREQLIIDKFRGRYHFLSNFYPSPIIWNNKFFPTVEHAYQAEKTTDPNEWEVIRTTDTPAQAKWFGRRVHDLRKDWDDVKVTIMKELLFLKFTSSEELKQQLLDTEDAELIEGNTWNDTFWGKCNGEGLNWLGWLLMNIRTELKNKKFGLDRVTGEA